MTAATTTQPAPPPPGPVLLWEQDKGWPTWRAYCPSGRLLWVGEAPNAERAHILAEIDGKRLGPVARLHQLMNFVPKTRKGRAS